MTKFISRQLAPDFVAKDPQASPVWEICNYLISVFQAKCFRKIIISN